MAKLTFKNVSGDDRNLGRPEGLPVKAGDVVAFDGTVVDELDDAYIVEQDGQARAWPKETWKLISKSGATAAAASTGGTES